MNRAQRRAEQTAHKTITATLTAAMEAMNKGDLEQADRLYRQVRALIPGVASVASNHGNVLLRLGNAAEAIAAYRQAVSLDPAQVGYQLNLANVLYRTEALDEAEQYLRRALALEPDHPGAWFDLGNVLSRQGRHAAAEAAYRRVLALTPNAAELYSNLSTSLAHQDRLDEAEDMARHAIKLAPDFTAAYANLGKVLAQKGQWEDSIDAFRQALRLNAAYAEAWSDLGHVYLELDRSGAALEAYNQALALRPDYPATQLYRALALLRLGEHEEGGAAYESRWQVPPHSGEAKPAEHLPRWSGESLAGKRLLVWHEQGFGDTIQFCRYAADLAAIGAEVIFHVPVLLADLLRNAVGVAEVVSELEPAFQADFQIPLLSIPHVLKRALHQSVAPVPYLHADADQCRLWQQKLAGDDRLKVGLAWSGDPRFHDRGANHTNRRRSVKFSQLAPLAGVKNISFFSLQKGLAASEIDSAAFGASLRDETAVLDTFSHTAALIVNFDLVITVDTSIAHLAGALGKPVWILLRLGACWRWSDSQDVPSLYPSARLFRQTVAGEWEPVISEVTKALEELGSSIRQS